MHITNFRQLSKTPSRKMALEILEAGYLAIDIEKTVKEKIALKGDVLAIKYQNKKPEAAILNLKDFKNIYLIGIGKGSASASLALAKMLKNRLTKGIALDVNIPDLKLQVANCEFIKGDHPLPSIRNIKATQKIMTLAQKAKENDLMIAFICGGGSALACASENELEAMTEVFKKLTEAGADIVELNTVRKHLSQIKGGNLAKLIYPATCISLVVSDVLGNDLSMISSGPTAYDKTTIQDAKKILGKYKSVIRHPIAGSQLLETPKEEKYFSSIKNILFVSNIAALNAMAQKAKELGLNPKIQSSKLKGEAKGIFSKLSKCIKSGEVILAGGEATVRLNSKSIGKGGRNQEAVLGFLQKIGSGTVIVSAASDAHDNTEAAGAIICELTKQKAKKLNLNLKEFLGNHNAFYFFEKTGDLIFAKKNCFNVADFMLMIKE